MALLLLAGQRLSWALEHLLLWALRGLSFDVTPQDRLLVLVLNPLALVLGLVLATVPYRVGRRHGVTSS